MTNYFRMPHKNSVRKLNLKDIKAIRALLFEKNERGYFEVRSSPEDNGTERGGDDTCDMRKWDQSDWGEPVHDDVWFPVCSCETDKDKNRRFWPEVYDGIQFDLYVRCPGCDGGPMNEPRDDWSLWGNEAVAFVNDEWRRFTHDGNGFVVDTQSFKGGEA